jgi:predicted small metal-binding protein
MLKFECKELETNCNYLAQGNKLEEVKKSALQHAQTVHGDLLEHMSPQQKSDLDKTVTRMTH